MNGRIDRAAGQQVAAEEGHGFDCDGSIERRRETHEKLADFTDFVRGGIVRQPSQGEVGWAGQPF